MAIGNGAVGSAFIAGHYNASYGGTFIGTTRDGFTITETPHYEPITVDEGGDAIINEINRGMDCHVALDYAEYNLVRNALYGSTNNGSGGAANVSIGVATSAVGQLATAQASALTLVPQFGTGVGPGATSPGNLTYTFPLALSRGDIRTILNTKLRQGPLEFKAYPNASNGTFYTLA